MRVLGIDPGVNHTGYGVIEQERSGPRYLTGGTITTRADCPFPERLKEIFDRISEVIDIWRPEVMAIEETIYAQNVKTALKLGHARGVVLLAGAARNLQIAEYAPRKIKSSVTGNGAAQKEQVQFMVRRLIKMPGDPGSLDESDALAAALCHLNQPRLDGIR